MKKKLNFIISLLLIFLISLGAFIMPASSFQNDVVTSSFAMLMVNLDTGTTVFSQKANKIWNASYLSELMTYILLREHVEDPEAVTVSVDEDFINELEDSDGCLENYLGEELTLKDLAAIMLLTSGSDAAFLIADEVGGSVATFVRAMNNRAAKLGCKNTAFITPGYSESKDQYTTCEDLVRIYRCLLDDDMFTEIMSSPTYIPARYGDDEEYAVTTENSIMNPVSPYYFRYVISGKFADDPTSGASIAVVTSYKNMKYLFIALRGKNEAEENVFTDARRLTTWAYLNLSDRKVIDTDESVDKVTAVSVWGEYPIGLYADNSARKTLPNEYEKEKFSVKMDVPQKLKLPLFKGEKVGAAEITYDKEPLDKVTIVPNHDEGVSMLSDLGRFGGYALAKLFPVTSPSELDRNSETEAPTEAPTKSSKKAAKPTQATETPTEESEAEE